VNSEKINAANIESIKQITDSVDLAP